MILLTLSNIGYHTRIETRDKKCFSLSHWRYGSGEILLHYQLLLDTLAVHHQLCCVSNLTARLCHVDTGESVILCQLLGSCDLVVESAEE